MQKLLLNEEASQQQQTLSLRSRQNSTALQGQVKINSYKPLKFNPIAAYILTPILTLLTCGIALIIIIKKEKYRSRMIYKKCLINEATHFLIHGNDETYEIIQVEEHNPTTIVYRKVKYQMVGRTFIVVAYDLEMWNGFQSNSKQNIGLSEEEYRVNLQTYGKCQHRVDIPTIWSYLGQQLAGILFILQYIICAIYVVEQMVFMAIVMIACSIITTVINYFLLRSSLKRIKEIAERTFIVQVYRSGKIVEVDSTELVPGDVYIPKPCREGLPCDSVIIKGELYLNEASLTGENVPIGKTPPVSFKDTETHNCWLNEGSQVLQSRGQPLALAVYTGFLTRKGRIIRKIIHKNQTHPEFMQNGFYFLMQLLVYCLIIFFMMIPTMARIQISDKLFVLRFFDMLGWVLPPTFPIYFNICFSTSLYRLRKLNIFGTEPLRTTISGKVKTICFDKTGTLTQNKMQLAEVIRFSQGSQAYFTATSAQKDEHDLGVKLFASCHTVRKINEEFMGDQLDLRMFLFSGFQYHSSDQVGVKLILKKNNVVLEVLKINQFESKFQSMSVLIREVRTNCYYIFVKGAPEKIRDLSTVKYNEFDSIVSKLSLSGLRSLAFGYKKINDPTACMNLTRQQFQNNIQLFGIVAFQNKLKLDTRDTIIKLKDAAIEVKIITGDNIYIGIETAIRAGIIESMSKVVVLQGSMQTIEFSQGIYHGELLQRDYKQTSSKAITLTKEQYQNQPHPIVIDNKFFNMNPTLPSNIKVFARISPQNKAKVIERLKQMKMEKWMSIPKPRRFFARTADKVGMVGDGANDILAIKQADLGVGISETDSSFAAHFTICNIRDVDCIVRQGRSTLMIVIQIFRYYTVISILKYFVCSMMAFDRTNYSDNQFLFFNYSGILQIVIMLCLSHPCQTLSPYIPNDNFLSLQNHLIVIGQIIIATVGMIISYYVATVSGYFTFNPDKQYNQWQFQCQSNTILFLTSQLYLIFAAIWIYTSRPWKQRIYKNCILTGWLLIVIVFNVTIFWLTPRLTVFFGLVDITDMVGSVFGITVAFLVVGAIWNEVIRCTRLHQK